jgi:hypothetical protein
MKRPLRESDIEKYLIKCVKELGGEVRKVQWIGRSGAPDRLVMLPPKFARAMVSKVFDVPEDQMAPESYTLGRTVWVELKAPGKKAEPHQLREHARMCKMGQRVVVIDSLEGVDEVLS